MGHQSITVGWRLSLARSLIVLLFSAHEHTARVYLCKRVDYTTGLCNSCIIILYCLPRPFRTAYLAHISHTGTPRYAALARCQRAQYAVRCWPYSGQSATGSRPYGRCLALTAARYTPYVHVANTDFFSPLHRPRSNHLEALQPNANAANISVDTQI